MQKRSEFLYVAKGKSVRMRNVVIQTRKRADDSPIIGEGFTSTKKIGGAVIRNRARRRLRVASRALLPRLGAPGHDYVFIARNGTAVAPWASLLDDVETALIRLHARQSDSRDQTQSRAG